MLNDNLACYPAAFPAGHRTCEISSGSSYRECPYGTPTLRSTTFAVEAYPAKTLTVFLDCVLSKKYLNPSSDIINILTGFDDVDSVFFEFADAIETALVAGNTGQYEPLSVLGEES